MGMSAGKWIKTVLFGKKNSKSKLSKNGTSDKKNAEKTQVEDLVRNSSIISEPRELTERGTQNLELEKGTSGSPCDDISVTHVDHQGLDSQSNDALVPVNEDEMRRQEQAATKAQAAFRGYMILVTLPNTMPLSLQYDLAELNSAWNWLERWSLSRFWEPPARTKKMMKSKPQRKQGSTHITEPDAGKSKRLMEKMVV